MSIAHFLHHFVLSPALYNFVLFCFPFFLMPLTPFTLDCAEYIHRVGRTARGLEGKGRALLFLLPEEIGFLRFLKHARVPLNEYEFPSSKVANIQMQLEKIVTTNYHLHQSAKDAFRSYLQAYASHSLKQIFEVNRLDLQKVPTHTYTYT